MSDKITQGTADLLSNLLKELASELDLHYEDEDFFALSPTIDVMKQAAFLLEQNGFPLPNAYEHVLKRYNRHRN